MTDQRDWAEKQELQYQTGLFGNFSLYDLRKIFYGGGLSTTDRLRGYLQLQTGLTHIQSLGDLWRQFFIAQGVTNQVSLGDMARAFFEGTGETIAISHILLQNGYNALLQNGSFMLYN